ncbi:MAG TPA: RDD family protein [Bacilli bacterium]|nr:RDD family protein [Bacilli bacterium]
MEKKFEIAPFSHRLGAYFIDFLIVLLFWYVVTIKDLDKVDKLLETINLEQQESLEIFIEGIFKLYVSFILKWLFIQTVYYTLLPSIIGRGKTLGKLLFGISMVDRSNLKEISPSRLILREFIARGLIETILIIPFFISMVLVCIRETRAIHDYIGKTIVIKDSAVGEEDEYA